ncbi:hypothetical protein EI74_0585 [Mycoplasma testudineum]|uniref:Uncharacterized protein n=1 Tax=Mycoplasma testudineum TaxID=244584 RepID=A0A4R6ICS3_9MOLU|nr:hypothetical protein [Mycoplasma testudineum]OYD26653.1 hypothetical protein CG473_02525 [Mycoplasma testudineum]TDO19782.1 hypothetical protein EI74_0585 [Mycoplasma testudineum]
MKKKKINRGANFNIVVAVLIALISIPILVISYWNISVNSQYILTAGGTDYSFTFTGSIVQILGWLTGNEGDRIQNSIFISNGAIIAAGALITFIAFISFITLIVMLFKKRKFYSKILYLVNIALFAAMAVILFIYTSFIITNLVNISTHFNNLQKIANDASLLNAFSSQAAAQAEIDSMNSIFAQFEPFSFIMFIVIILANISILFFVVLTRIFNRAKIKKAIDTEEIKKTEN